MRGDIALWYAIRMAQSVENLTPQNTGEPSQQTNAKEKGWSYKGENLRLTFDMQTELARRFFGLPKTIERRDLDDVVFRWVDNNNGSNSRNFRNFVEAHP
jgi:hypothetical protein